MRLARVVPAVLAAAVLVVCTAGAATHVRSAGTPIVIGAAVDLTKNMSSFDAPALEAAKLEIAKIDAAGGIDGHMLQLKFYNDQLDTTQTKEDAAKLVSQNVNIGWVTCDVNYATPAIQEFLAAKILTVSPCIGTDQMGPSRFGAEGNVAFTFGNPAQQDGASLAEWAYSKGWHTA